MPDFLRRYSWSFLSPLPALLSAVMAAGSPAFMHAQASSTSEDAHQAFYKEKIQPILSSHCYDCHSADAGAAAGLRVDDRAALLKGGKSGPAIVPGKPEESLLLERVLTTDVKQRMPKGDDPLPAKEIEQLKAWIADGAAWSEATPSSTSAPEPSTPPAKEIKASLTRVPYPRPATPAQLAFFEKKVRPILVNRCYNCHSAAFKEAGGLRVDVGISIFAGGKDGAVIIPGHPEESLLIQRVKSSDPKKRMPQESNEALPADEIATLEAWIKDGAAWPDETEKLPPTPERLRRIYPQLRAEWWSWQPLAHPVAPVIAGDTWSSGNIDRFILANLQAKKLAPVPDADPAVLLRRVSYDLTGLPPTPAEIRAFQKDHSPQAYAALVDRLLASPQFGERWGRNWLDVARYAESSGPSRNMPYPNAWRYRDYVIDAYNRDVPFNRFLTEQIAGDLLPAATPADHDRLLIATGYLALGPKDVNQRFKARFKMDIVDDQIDTVTRSTMALTVSCARCHDHKFDPIPTTDYYALAGIFTSTEDDAGLTSKMGGSSLEYYDPKHLGYLSDAAHAPVIASDIRDKAKAERDAAKKQLDEAQAAIDKEKKEGTHATPTPEQKQRLADLQRNFVRLRENYALLGDLGELGYGIHSVRDGEVADTSVRIRGVEERHGPTVPRGFLTVLPIPGTTQIPAGHSGRLELAEWITNPANPLTTRVYVNRAWEHLFGTGLVSTVDNFGSSGDKPANPALLDYLSQDFMANGWSTKKLVREIVLSHAYRLGSAVPPGYQDVDPADRFIWRHNPRRLETEEIRDSILASAGDLNLAHPSGSSSMALRMIEIRDDGPVVSSVLDAADRNRYRSVYLPLLRDETPRTLSAFDPVSQTLVSGKREVTTVPSQALFMLNSPFVREQSLLLAEELLRAHGSDAKRIRIAYQRVLSTSPSEEDVRRVQDFLAAYERNAAPAIGRQTVQAHLQTVAGSSAPHSLTEGIVREDGLTQDDAIDNEQADTAKPDTAKPGSAKEAAWAAFIQALYGSAAFQFVR
ncbi:PSD1 and planctomycete cytochrome C domain-containing protein [Silvibacterium dinghuense]|uniref:DUF1549 domain-containing protein n=1 Tax=Silvibacterium dinghuense TaxID=1560006 RepID=A0A4Q1SIY9_9BACT|nr:PSD1 and planctomycete cytochrome C domain-containing protein [Silvibacterium dinghuense]RXS97598.1 DUF1549 domain-containing protein [Silvibacterium dinghuense]